MATEIRWADNAIRDYKNVVNYLQEDWNEDIVLRFIELLENKIQHIVKHPYTGLRSQNNPDIRSISVTKHNR